MIGYVTLGITHLENAKTFYDKLLFEIGGSHFFETEEAIIYGFGPDAPPLMITLPHNKETATNGNGTMVGLRLKSVEEVDRMHALALELGASDEGAPGMRSGTFYAAYFRDPDGNKLNFFVPNAA
ncbi:MAG: VOC family protein [Thalassovita sp.]